VTPGRRLLLAVWLAACASPQEAPIPPEVEAVRKHLLEQDYPEIFGSDPYRMRIENVLVTDLDGDGDPEVVAHTWPHYRQSATITIFRLTRDLAVTRVAEALAPGPLQPLSGDYLDSHVLGEAFDFSVDADPAQHEKLLQLTLASGFGGAVEYASFWHADNRKGPIYYVDMTAVEIPDGGRDCERFEFSRVDEIAAGALDGGDGKTWLAARVGPELWLYRITRFLPNGLLEKQVRVQPLPDDFAGFEPGPSTRLRYRTSGGDVRALQP
jgi:hypothetical protein